MRDTLSLTAAQARSKDEFCIAIRETNADAPTTYILVYEGGLAQPWSRIDVSRTIVSITETFCQDDGNFAAVSDEGDIYVLGMNHPLTQKVKGSGVYSADSTGRGYIACITEIGKNLYVGGSTAQVYRSGVAGLWTDIAGLAIPTELGFEDFGVAFIASSNEQDLYVGGSITVARRRPTDAEMREAEEAAAAGNIERMVQLLDTMDHPTADYTDKGRLYNRLNDRWTRVELPRSAPLRGIFVEAADKVWIVGYGGIIFMGNAANGFHDLSLRGDTETILSFTKFGNRYVAASDSAIHWFNGHNLEPLRPTTTTSVLSPFKVQAVEDILFYFDRRQGIHRYDGFKWEESRIPPELLDRHFRGLTR